MAEFLRVTQPIVNRSSNITAQGKPLPNPSMPFQVIDTGKVQSMSTSKQTAQQNNTLQLDADQPSILSQMLQDPTQTVHFLKTIYLLQEVVGMLPMVDNPVSKEIEELFNNLLLNIDDVVGEMMKQENSATLFKGELFDNLRNMIEAMKQFDAQNQIKNDKGLLGMFNKENDNQTAQNLMNHISAENGLSNYEAQIKVDISTLLKYMNNVAYRGDILHSIGNNLEYLASAMAPHKNLSQNLLNLSDMFKNPSGTLDFRGLKALVNQYMNQIEKSVLYNEKVAKNISILNYNFSRFEESTEGLEKATANMFKYLLDEKDMEEFQNMVYKETLRMASQEGRENSSKVMNTLCKLIEKQVENSSLTNLTGDKIEKIIYSLLSSPTNFTPLLHYVIPVEYMGMRAFAEAWIDPICEDDENTSSSKKKNGDSMQVLVAFDIDTMGRFETELFVNQNKMSAFIYVPSDYYEVFKDMTKDVAKAIANTKFNFEKVEVLPLAAPRSLMEVFKTLPIRRTGINVTV